MRHAIGNLQADAVGGSDLEQARLETETLGDVTSGWERLLDGVDQSLGAAVHVAGGLAPFDHRVFTQRCVASDEVECGFAKFIAELFELVGEVTEARVGNKATDATQEREAGAFDGGIGSGFNESECREGIARDEPLVAELDETIADMGGIEPEVFGIEAFATAPLTDGGGDEHSAPADAIEKRLIVGTIVRIHGVLF